MRLASCLFAIARSNRRFQSCSCN